MFVASSMAPVDPLAAVGDATSASTVSLSSVPSSVPSSFSSLHHTSNGVVVHDECVEGMNVRAASTTATVTADVVVDVAAAAVVVATAAATAASLAVAAVTVATTALVQSSSPSPSSPPSSPSREQQLPPSSPSSQPKQQQQQQPLLDVLRAHPICFPEGAIDSPDALQDVLKDIDRFLEACNSTNDADASYGRAPGFWTRSSTTTTTNNHHRWIDAKHLPYQLINTMATCTTAADGSGSGSTLPVPSVQSAQRCYMFVRQMVQNRLEHLLNNNTATTSCSCIDRWYFVLGDTLGLFINQAFEQLMAQEASEVLNNVFRGESLEAWNASYKTNSNNLLSENAAGITTASTNNNPLVYFDETPMEIIVSRDLYMAAFVRAALAAQHTIQIATCYFFWDDPAQCYILIDLLPYIVRTKGVRVQLLIDLLPVESNTLRSACCYAGGTKASGDPNRLGIGTAFWNHLPANRPEPSNRKFQSPAHFLQSILDMAAVSPDHFDVQFWCARDSLHHYRVKSHVKCAVFDRQVAMMGGSNVTPTVKSAFSELDGVLAGPAAAAVAESFDSLWTAVKMTETIDKKNEGVTPDYYRIDDEKKVNNELWEFVQSREWHDSSAKVAILRSTPSSSGEDVILRVVLDKIRAANSEVIVCMGHSCYCKAFVDAVAEAARRGVVVRILVNSLYSNDLRTGQVDLFRSLRDIFVAAPSVQVYATTMPHLRDPSMGTTSPRPEFLHAKFVVVDREWSAVGSWNLWTRSAFYEIELEAFVQSTKIAKILCDKFEDNRQTYTVLITAEECIPGCGHHDFCPRGCNVCEGFGPFFAEHSVSE